MKHSLAPAPDVSRETFIRLGAVEVLLRRWNRTINLVSRGDEANLWHRHFEDSLQLVPLLPSDAKTGVDLGSGAGFPGLVLAIASGIHFHLIESDHRKAAFLREAVAATDAPATIHATRIETMILDPVDVLTARGLAPLPELLVLGARFLKPNGTVLLLKGTHVDQEITAAATRWSMTVTSTSSKTNPMGQVLKITGITHVA